MQPAGEQLQLCVEHVQDIDETVLRRANLPPLRPGRARQCQPLQRRRAEALVLTQVKRLKLRGLDEDIVEGPPSRQRAGPDDPLNRVKAKQFLQLLDATAEPKPAFNAPVDVLVTRALRLVQGIRCFQGSAAPGDADSPFAGECGFILGEEVETAQLFEEGDIVRLVKVWVVDAPSRVWFVAAVVERFLT